MLVFHQIKAVGEIFSAKKISSSRNCIYFYIKCKNRKKNGEKIGVLKIRNARENWDRFPRPKSKDFVDLKIRKI